MQLMQPYFMLVLGPKYVELEAMLHNRAHLQLLEVNHSVDGAEDAKAQDRQQGRLQRRTTGPAIVRVGASCRSVMLQQLLLHGCAPSALDARQVRMHA